MAGIIPSVLIFLSDHPICSQLPADISDRVQWPK